MNLDEETPLQIATRLLTAVGAATDLLYELRYLHAWQWRLEDETRLPDASAESVAAAKAGIDRLNARRHRLIDLIDQAAAQPPLPAPSRYYTETIGELCDRLLILELKLIAVTDDRAEPLTRVCEHLAAAATELVDDLSAGRAALPPRVGVKIYNGACPEDVDPLVPDTLVPTGA